MSVYYISSLSCLFDQLPGYSDSEREEFFKKGGTTSDYIFRLRTKEVSENPLSLAPKFSGWSTDKRKIYFNYLKYDFIRFYLKLESRAKENSENQRDLEEFIEFLKGNVSCISRYDTTFNSNNFQLGQDGSTRVQDVIQWLVDPKNHYKFLEYSQSIRTENITWNLIASKELVEAAIKRGAKLPEQKNSYKKGQI